MNRRNFLKIGLPATGMALVVPSMAANALADINRQFSGAANFESYDLVINGGGLSGYFAALEAKKLGKRVLLVERRSALGYEFSAKGKFWIGTEGLEGLSPDLQQILWSQAEMPEVHAKEGKGAGAGIFENNLAFLAGSFKKNLLREVLSKKIDVLLMTDVCGLFSDQGVLQGALLASKHGLFAVKCNQFLDASEHAVFSRRLQGIEPTLKSAKFVLEIWKTKGAKQMELVIPKDIAVLNNKANIFRGKHADHQVFLEFEIDAKGMDLETVEHKAREIAFAIGSNLNRLDPMFAESEINQLSWETTATLEQQGIKKSELIGHHILPDSIAPKNCKELAGRKSEMSNLLNGIKFQNRGKGALKMLHIVGGTINAKDLQFADLTDPSLRIPLSRCFVPNKSIPKRTNCQVFVAGGGTAGAMAGIGAITKGANTIVADCFQDLGGTKTMSGVMGYYHGYRNQLFFKQQDDEANKLAVEGHLTKRLGRMLYLLQQTLKSGGRFIGSAQLCGAVYEGKKVQGGIICRYGTLEAILADVSIDGTGDGDLAAFAGAAFDIGDKRTGKTQNFSQWDIRGAGKMPTHTNRDYDVIDNTKISEVQRAFFISHYEAHHYDFYPMMAVRESRRVKGEYELNVIDALEGTHFNDTICLASSDFDPHYVGMSDYTRCGFLLPHSVDLVVEIPYRSLIPKGMDGLLLSGRGFSQTQEAYQFTRMTADLIVLGYLTGQIAATLAFNGIAAKELNLKDLQKEWDSLGYYDAGFLDKPTGNKLDNPKEAERRINAIAQGKREFLYHTIKIKKEIALPLLKAAFQKSSNVQGKLLLAKALAWFEDSQGSGLILKELEGLYKDEQQKGYEKSFVDNYDLIRGREHNILEGNYWRINQDIALLGRARFSEATPMIKHILETSESGGPMMMREDAYFNERIDLKLVPFHNRLLNLSYFIERVPDAKFIDGLTQLLKKEYVGGYRTSNYEQVRWRVYGGDLELFLAAGLARCGAKQGYDLLADYLLDVHYNFKSFAASELQKLTGKDYQFDAASWKKLLSSQSYPRVAQKILS